VEYIQNVKATGIKSKRVLILSFCYLLTFSSMYLYSLDEASADRYAVSARQQVFQGGPNNGKPVDGSALMTCPPGSVRIIDFGTTSWAECIKSSLTIVTNTSEYSDPAATYTTSSVKTEMDTVTTQVVKTVTESGATITKTTQSSGTESAVSATATEVAITGITKGVIAAVKDVIGPQKVAEVKALTDLLSKVSNKVEKTRVKTVQLPKKTATTESAVSLTPEMCSVSGLTITSLAKGLCKVAYTVTGSSNILFTIEKTFNFTK